MALGRAYAMGYGVPQDYVKAHMWVNLAAAQDDGAAEACDDLAESMTREQVAEAQRRTREWLERESE